MKKFQDTFDKWSKLNKQLFTDSENYLKEILVDCPYNYLDLKPDNSDHEFDVVTVSYNGGRHPEYASNCYSTVYGVFLKNDKLYLNIEDCDEYPANEVTAEELFNVASLTLDIIEHMKEN